MTPPTNRATRATERRARRSAPTAAPPPRHLKSRTAQVQHRSPRRQSGYVLVRPDSAGWRTTARAAVWRTRLGKRSPLSGQVPPPRTNSPPVREALTQALADLRQQQRMLHTELTRTKAELSRLHAELTGTQADERTARYQALHDGLTGQPNRRLFMEELHKAMCQLTKNRSATSVMYLDIDGFKLINDEYGHLVGDAVLRTVGARLAKSVRTGDVVARLGGDEFACLLQGTLSQPQLMALAHKLHRSIAAPMKLGTLTLHVQVSIGLACAPDDSVTEEALLARADAAMYHAKRHRQHVAFAAAAAPEGPAEADPVPSV